ncbi:MAG: hypothetical protein GJ680_18295 [Alteromonadaceae bacterium]|nr:hypothetical protein [Alteromonadaceae bacterium]
MATSKNTKATSLNNEHARRVQIAAYAKESGMNETQLARKFGVTEHQVKSALSRDKRGTLLKKNGKNMNPNWFGEDCFFHSDDTYLFTARERGEMKDSISLHGLMDPDYDEVNGGNHFKWGETQCLELWEGIVTLAMKHIRDCDESSEDFKEALLLLRSDGARLYAKAMHIDLEAVILAAQNIKKGEKPMLDHFMENEHSSPRGAMADIDVTNSMFLGAFFGGAQVFGIKG